MNPPNRKKLGGFQCREIFFRRKFSSTENLCNAHAKDVCTPKMKVNYIVERFSDMEERFFYV